MMLFIYYNINIIINLKDGHPSSVYARCNPATLLNDRFT